MCLNVLCEISLKGRSNLLNWDRIFIALTIVYKYALQFDHINIKYVGTAVFFLNAFSILKFIIT